LDVVAGVADDRSVRELRSRVAALLSLQTPEHTDQLEGWELDECLIEARERAVVAGIADDAGRKNQPLVPEGLGENVLRRGERVLVREAEDADPRLALPLRVSTHLSLTSLGLLLVHDASPIGQTRLVKTRAFRT
jgi:hypothetical protein